MVPLKHSELPPRFKKAIMIVRAQCHCEKNNRREEETSRLMDAQTRKLQDLDLYYRELFERNFAVSGYNHN